MRPFHHLSHLPFHRPFNSSILSVFLIFSFIFQASLSNDVTQEMILSDYLVDWSEERIQTELDNFKYVDDQIQLVIKTYLKEKSQQSTHENLYADAEKIHRLFPTYSVGVILKYLKKYGSCSMRSQHVLEKLTYKFYKHSSNKRKRPTLKNGYIREVVTGEFIYLLIPCALLICCIFLIICILCCVIYPQEKFSPEIKCVFTI